MSEAQANDRVESGTAGVAGAGLAAHNWGWYLFRGLLALALGILALLYPFSAVSAFALVFAAYAFVDGVGLLISGIRGAVNHRERSWGLILAGLVGIAVGVMYVLWPALSTISYALIMLFVIAAWAFITGLGQISAAIRLRKEIEGEWLLGLSGVLSVLLGVAIVVATTMMPGASILSLGWIIGFYALLVAAVLIALAFRLKAAQAKS